MTTIDNLSSIEGRKFLHNLFLKLRYEKQLSSFFVLFACYRICVFESDTSKFINTDVIFRQKLGFFAGTKLWLEEIVHRYYFTTINSFVYFGAAILLVLVGFRKFYNLDTKYVIGGLIFEASLLMLIFITMLFAPNDDFERSERKDDTQDLINEVGEISTDFAKSVEQLDSLNVSLITLVEKQDKILSLLDILITTNTNIITPNQEFKQIIQENNSEIINFTNSVKDLNKSLNSIKSEQIKQEVKTEIEKIINKNLLSM